MLTQKDLDEIENIIDEKLNDQLKVLPTKDEFFTSQDELMGELKAIWEELPILNHQIRDHTDRIEKLEKFHPHSPSLA